jgi:formylglycine-generating enzyme required for sulfatase activity
MSAIFISYTGRDPEGDAWADRLVAWCEEWNYGCFRDRDHSCGIKAGDDWRAELYQQLRLAQVLVCLVSRSYESSAWCVGEVAIAVEKGKTVIPIHLVDSDVDLKTQPLPLLLLDRQAIQVARAADPSPEQLAQVKERLRRSLEGTLVWRQLLPWDPQQPPYPGLPAFEAHQAPVFFGRDGAIETVVERLAGLALRSPAFLLLLGASGYGKSSLVRAGVVTRLQHDRERGWLVLPPFTPGDEPFAELAEAVSAAGGEYNDSDPLGSLQALRRRSKAPVLLVIDQFEELLNGAPGAEGQPAEGERFLAFLEALLRLRRAGLLVLATMRTDCLAPLQMRRPALTGLATTLTLEPIAPEDFGQLITGPADRAQLSLQPGLVERLVNESGGRDALPLLAFTLEKLWQAHKKRGVAVAGSRPGEQWHLTLHDYDALGGVAGAVSTRANECWDPQTSSEAVRQALREAFLEHLVSVSSDGRAAKRAAPLADLRPESLEIVQRLVNDRLLVQKDGIVEIAHEALLRTWEPLKQWIDEGREELLQCLRVKRLADDLKPTAAERQRRQALEQLAALAAAGGSEQLAVRKEGADALAQLLAEAQVPLADQEDAALVLALIGAEEPLRVCLANAEAPPALRRRAAESLGLLARRCGKTTPQAIEQRQRIEAELENWLRGDPLDLLVEDDAGWAEHDARLPLLQGASRGLQLAASADLPLLGSGPGRVVPMLTLTALEEGSGLRIRTEVVAVPVWRLPLPWGEQLELVVVPAGHHVIGSEATESGRDLYPQFRRNCEGVDVEALRPVRLESYGMVRHPISQAQWQALVEHTTAVERELEAAPGKAHPEALWDRWGEPGAIAVDSVSWHDSQEWLGRLNRWLAVQGPPLGGTEARPQLHLPSESQWEVACQASPLGAPGQPFHFGATLDASWARYDASFIYGKGRKGRKVKQPGVNGAYGLVNRWGLADLHGQLWEWCADRWQPDPCEEEAGAGEAGEGEERHQERRFRISRGGSWFHNPRLARCSFRNSSDPDFDGTYGGLRLCWRPPG